MRAGRGGEYASQTCQEGCFTHDLGQLEPGTYSAQIMNKTGLFRPSEDSLTKLTKLPPRKRNMEPFPPKIRVCKLEGRNSKLSKQGCCPIMWANDHWRIKDGSLLKLVEVSLKTTICW